MRGVSQEELCSMKCVSFPSYFTSTWCGPVLRGLLEADVSEALARHPLVATGS
jgi:hypothetical protein